jgi:tRNA1Val (adenine37-N6)-methyltransferase
MPQPVFHFKQFSIHQDRCALKVGTDGVLLGAWADLSGASSILDIGTGTGVLALIAAQRAPAARIDAVEIDEASAAQAAENAAASPWAGRIRVHNLDARKLHLATRVDGMLCNPPYYPGEMSSSDPRIGIAKHAEGFTFTDLANIAEHALDPVNGRLDVIVPIGREQEFTITMAAVGLAIWRRCEVRYLEGRPAKRVLLELAFDPARSPSSSELIVEHAPGLYTEAYRMLMRDLLLKC